jgi:phytoene dehydrogenase-like protein
MGEQSLNYDVIIIGSGIGALSAGGILAKTFGKRVLILERHFKAGGFTHTFKRKDGYHWDVGLHYVGELNPKSMPYKLFHYLSDGKIIWNKMPEPYDKFVYPDFSFEFYSGKKFLKYSIVKAFPHEERAIGRYFRDIDKAMAWSAAYNFSKMFPSYIGAMIRGIATPFKKLALSTTKEYLDSNFKDEKLKALLASQWGDYGLPPSQSAFEIHAMIASHYYEGGYYPAGGSKVIGDSIIPAIEKLGGAVLVSHTAEEIIVKDSRAIGVKVKDSHGELKEFYARDIISNAGAYLTYTQLLKDCECSFFKEAIKNLPDGYSHVNLYIGLKDDPRKLGVTGGNIWIYDSYDHDAMAQDADAIINGKPHAIYLSFPSLKDPLAKGHTAEIIAYADYSRFAKWKDQPWKNRDAEYQALKESIAKGLIEMAGKTVKGFSGIVDYYELSTPLSSEHFTGFKNGAIYGLPAVPAKYNISELGVYTPVKNLYIAGADSFSHGIMGAFFGGVFAAAAAMGSPKSLFKIFGAADKGSRKKA